MNVLKATDAVMSEPATLPSDRPITLQDLYSVESLDGFKKIEIVDGEWYLTEQAYYSRPDFRVSLIQTRLMVALGTHIRLKKLGRLLSGSLGFVLEGHHNAIQLLRRTDIAFVRKGRISINDYEPYYLAPALTVHIQTNHSSEDMMNRINDFLQHGTQQVWQVSTKDQQIIVHKPGGVIKTYAVKDKLDGGPLLSGFRLDMSKVFES